MAGQGFWLHCCRGLLLSVLQPNRIYILLAPCTVTQSHAQRYQQSAFHPVPHLPTWCVGTLLRLDA